MKWQRLHAKREKQVNIQLTEELRKLKQLMSVQLRCEELREAELKMEVSICGPKRGEILGEEINEKYLMDYWNSSEELEDMLTREVDEAMKPCIFKSHSLCMFARCAEDSEQFDGTVTKENETLEVKSSREFLSEKESVDWLQQEDITNDFLFGIRQQVEAVMEQE